MRLALKPHPDAPAGPVTGIEVEVNRDGSKLALRYRARGRIADVLLPQAAAPARRDDLWKHTCFEAFLRAGGGGYVELNLSPSSEWAAYRFTGYRAGLTPAAVPAVTVTTERGDGLFELNASVDVGGEIVFDTPAAFGLSAVIEDVSGAKTYWALAHAPGKPDFHHPDAFASELPRDQP
ncbi:MAG TPA: DOMON-like domain-containing protein [Caulobacteraceae bacterium]|jgi:hypothetical protein